MSYLHTFLTDYGKRQESINRNREKRKSENPTSRRLIVYLQILTAKCNDLFSILHLVKLHLQAIKSAVISMLRMQQRSKLRGGMSILKKLGQLNVRLLMLRGGMAILKKLDQLSGRLLMLQGGMSMQICLLKRKKPYKIKTTHIQNRTFAT